MKFFEPIVRQMLGIKNDEQIPFDLHMDLDNINDLCNNSDLDGQLISRQAIAIVINAWQKTKAY